METLEYKFVKSIPEEVEDLIIYISMEYGTAIHKCICGCGNEVITPFTPTDWELTFNGESVSLSPSIGNWSFKCQSHYWIIENEIIHAQKWSSEEIVNNRKSDRRIKEQFYSSKKSDEELAIPREETRTIFKWSDFKAFITNLFILSIFPNKS